MSEVPAVVVKPERAVLLGDCPKPPNRLPFTEDGTLDEIPVVSDAIFNYLLGSAAIINYLLEARYLSRSSYRSYLLLVADPIRTSLGPLLLS